MQKIYLKTKRKFKNPYQLLKWGFEKYHIEKYGNKKSPVTDWDGFFTYTYKDKACTKHQCFGGRRRSFTDLLFLVNTYMPCTPRKLAETLEMLRENMNLGFIFCGDVDKVVFRRYTRKGICQYRKYDGIDGFNMDHIIKIGKFKNVDKV